MNNIIIIFECWINNSIMILIIYENNEIENPLQHWPGISHVGWLFLRQINTNEILKQHQSIIFNYYESNDQTLTYVAETLFRTLVGYTDINSTKLELCRDKWKSWECKRYRRTSDTDAE